MSRVPRMAATFLRLVTSCGLLLIVVCVAWTTLSLSARHSRRLWDRPVYGYLDPTDNRTWKSPARLLVAGDDGQFYLNGKPKRLISGEFHYFRVHPSQWDDRLRRMRTAGLNTITTRVPWNFHERRQSTFQFRGKGNLADFIHRVHRLGFLLIVHIGPYIDADWEFGGLPSWLLRDRHMMVRTSYAPFIQYVRRYFAHLLPIIDRASYRKHGPVIAVQIDNEFGSYGHEDDEYLRALVGLVRRHGIHELILTADRPAHLSDGAIPGALATVTCSASAVEVARALTSLVSFQPNLPRLVTLFELNGTSRWGEHSTRHIAASTANFRRSVDLILTSNASINIYAFAGGTNFGFWNGAVEDAEIDSASVSVVSQVVRRRGKHHHRRPARHRRSNSDTVEMTQEHSSQLVYRPVTTSYNYNPPPIVSQSGRNQFSQKYHEFRRLLLDRGFISRLQAVPTNPAASATGTIRLDHQLGWEPLLGLISSSALVLDSPVFMELLNTQLGSGQDRGWIIYRTRVKSAASHVNISGTMRDRLQLFVNGRHLQTVYNNKLLPLNIITTVDQSHVRHTDNNLSSHESTLELIVENMGRASFGLLDDQRKGFEGSVTVDGRSVESHWEHFSLDFSTAFLAAVRDSRDWVPIVRPLTTVQSQPTMYRGHFKVKQSRDTYIDMSKWTKGVVVVNGFVLGRYWNVGPQQSLYVPSPILSHGLNEILVFELERTLNAKVKLVGQSAWSHHKNRG